MGAGRLWRRRLGCALALVLAPLVVLAVGQSAVEATTPRAPGAFEELAADVGLRTAQEAPGWFVEEVVDVDGREELRANGDWSVVSFIAGGEGALPDTLVRELEGRGWALLASGQEGVWTGVKEGGRCSWLALSCTKMGDALCVVLQVDAPMR